MVIRITYRPEDCPFSSFDEVLKPNYIQALLLKKPILISGDLSCLKKTCSEFKALEKLYTQMNLLQPLEKPTRITEKHWIVAWRDPS